MHLDPVEFDDLVEQAWRDLLDKLPPELERKAAEIVLVVADRPAPEQAAELGQELLGLFEGLSLAEDGPGVPWSLPPQIVLFRQNLLEYCLDLEELREEIHVTLAHELGHYFGFGEAALADLGLA